MDSLNVFVWFVILLFVISPLILFNKSLKKNLGDRSQNRFLENNRFSRSEHAIRFLFILVINIFITSIASQSSVGTSLILLLISISLFIYYYIIAIKRLHDLNMSGWYSLILLIPFSGLILLLCLFFIKGSHNRFDNRDEVTKNLKENG